MTRSSSGSSGLRPLVRRMEFQRGYSLLVDEQELLALDAGRHGPVFGLAVDIGTVSVCVGLCNLENGDEVAAATVRNRQMAYGADIRQRLSFSAQTAGHRELLGRAAIASINQAIRQCLEKSGTQALRIVAAVVVGHPAMHQFLFRMPVARGARVPFTGAGISLVKATVLGIQAHPNANIRFLPAGSGAVGSDCLAAIINVGMDRATTPHLCVDLGANGKIIVGCRGKIVVASTTRGPAFEGYHITCGMIAKPGAIEWVRLENNGVRFLTIGHIHPEGLCGSGILDLVGEMRRTGKIDAKGKMREKRFTVYKDRRTRIEFTQDDLRRIQSSKAAVHAGIQVVLRLLKLKAADIQRVYLAGALGDYLNAEHIERLGILPAGLRAPLSYVGNAAFSGAKQYLMDHRARERVHASIASVRHVELHEYPSFYGYFRRALVFPGGRSDSGKRVLSCNKRRSA